MSLELRTVSFSFFSFFLKTGVETWDRNNGGKEFPIRGVQKPYALDPVTVLTLAVFNMFYLKCDKRYYCKFEIDSTFHWKPVKGFEQG